MTMTPLLVVGGYLVAFVVVARVAYVRFDKSDPDDPLDDNGLSATLLGLVWPLTVAVLALRWLWLHSIGRETPRQRRTRLAKEAKALRIEAAKLGLHVPVLDEESAGG